MPSSHGASIAPPTLTFDGHSSSGHRRGVGQALPDPTFEVDRRSTGTLPEDAELVTAEAGDDVAGPDDRGESVGHRGQYGVPGGVTALVVDALESVHVDERGVHSVSGSPTRSHEGRPQQHEAASVEEAGEVVVHGGGLSRA